MSIQFTNNTSAADISRSNFTNTQLNNALSVSKMAMEPVSAASLSGLESIKAELAMRGIDTDTLSAQQLATLGKFGGVIDALGEGKAGSISQLSALARSETGVDLVGRNNLATDDGQKLLGFASEGQTILLDNSLNDNPQLLARVGTEELAEAAFQSVFGRSSNGDFGAGVAARMTGDYAAMTTQEKQALLAENDQVTVDGKKGEAIVISGSASSWGLLAEDETGGAISGDVDGTAISELSYSAGEAGEGAEEFTFTAASRVAGPRSVAGRWVGSTEFAEAEPVIEAEVETLLAEEEIAVIAETALDAAALAATAVTISPLVLGVIGCAIVVGLGIGAYNTVDYLKNQGRNKDNIAKDIDNTIRSGKYTIDGTGSPDHGPHAQKYDIPATKLSDYFNDESDDIVDRTLVMEHGGESHHVSFDFFTEVLGGGEVTPTREMGRNLAEFVLHLRGERSFTGNDQGTSGVMGLVEYLLKPENQEVRDGFREFFEANPGEFNNWMRRAAGSTFGQQDPAHKYVSSLVFEVVGSSVLEQLDGDLKSKPAV